jgi:hypothetical protein
MIEFVGFPKISRLSRDVIVTEKIDGTNGTIYIGEDGLEFLVGSRTRWITPDCDNHGFARWAYDNHDDLLKLGPGWHRGEWWGSGIQRGYGLPKGEKHFSLFNTIRWCRYGHLPQRIETQDPQIEKYQDVLPCCCDLVPVLYKGPFDTALIDRELSLLLTTGSKASPGFANPEGIVVFHIAGNVGFKKTIGNDGHKGGK